MIITGVDNQEDATNKVESQVANGIRFNFLVRIEPERQ
jgi:hypothetical protein